MAPYTFSHATGALVAVAFGFLFGFVLERAGFGNARNLAAQFYLYDMRVLKVMFTAIVTAMVLLFFAAALGLVDFARVWAPPTYLWPGIVGGFLLGVGFIIGGYCPGTSLVAVSTFKIDGIVYSLGVLSGLFLFGETVPAFWGFFNNSGAWGRWTLFDLLGVDAGTIVLAVVVMAVGVFAFAEWMERRFARPGNPPPPRSSRAKRILTIAVGSALGIAMVTAAIEQPSVERRIAWASEGLAQSLRERKVHIDPAELLALMHNNRARIVLTDVRHPSDYNIFHLLDAQNTGLAELDARWVASLPKDSVVVVMSNDEQAAAEAWRRLAVQLNPNPQAAVTDKSRVYILAGGVNRWLDIYRHGRNNAPGPETPAEGDDSMLHAFARALGSREPAARPELRTAPKRDFISKVQAVTPARAVGGGCG